jgi:glutathione S-transferase
MAALKLYITLTSPYARLVRALIIEKDLQHQVDVIPIQTRVPDSPLYAINPSGRVPTLVTADGRVFEDSAVICEYLDQLDGAPIFHLPGGDRRWPALRLEAKVRSMLDGISVWGRELYRPLNERSPTVIAHERARAFRMIGSLEADVDAGLFDGPLTQAQLLLACALHSREDRLPDFPWRDGHPALSGWIDRFAARPSLMQTIPPPHPSESANLPPAS